MANGNQSTADGCGEPVEGSGAPLLVPSVTGPVSNSTPLIISTIGGTEVSAGDPPPDTEAVSVGSSLTECPWPLILLAFVLAFMLTRKRG